jgi:2-keto-4-pentenoate hydratase/2-oxohepta-3-ene-1,7-dioic acid hydratase in catechol pathway
MKLGRINVSTPDGDQPRIVAVLEQEGRTVDLARAYATVLRRRAASAEAATRLARTLFPSSMSQAIASGDLFRETAELALAGADDASADIDSVSWIAAVDAPVIRDSLTYPIHMEHFAAKVGGNLPPPQIFKTPPYFKGSASMIYGHGQVVPYPSYTSFMDWELEIGIIVGSPGHNLSPKEAESRIFGYTIFNDFSARDVQSKEMTMGMGPQKSKDFAFGIGPWIVTVDEIPSLAELTGSVRLNGEVVSTCTADGGIISPAELVAWVSVSDNVLPGDLIALGTLGNGSGLEIDRKLEPGDVLELQLDKVGVLKTIVGEPEVAPWWPQEKPYPWTSDVATESTS